MPPSAIDTVKITFGNTKRTFRMRLIIHQQQIWDPGPDKSYSVNILIYAKQPNLPNSTFSQYISVLTIPQTKHK